MNWLHASRSLLITGLADVWSSLGEGKGQGSAQSGLVLMVTSAAFFTLMAAFAKKLLPDAPMQAVVLSRGFMMTLVFAAVGRWQGVSLMGSRTRKLILRGLLGYMALSCYFYSVQHLPLGDAVLIQYSHPIFVAAIAPLLLRERSGPLHWALVTAALVGVGLIVNPQGHLRAQALVGVLGALCSGLAYMTVRDLSRTEQPLTILVWFTLVSVPPSFLATLAAGSAAIPRDGREVAGHLLVTGTALLGQVTLTLRLARAGAARATAVTLTGPVFGLVYGYLMFGTIPAATSLAGAAIVLTSLGLLGWRPEPRPAPETAHGPTASRS
jgi:drug/metabolite transporter (DMT)-like permease